MPRLRKAIFNRQVYMLTVSIEQGIMLPPNPIINFLLLAALLRAHKHHPIEICHFVINGNHIHLIVIVDNPLDIPGFMERFKTESAHYLNRHIGRRKRTVWCESYDSPALLTVEDVIKRIVYIYTNPVKDGLIDSISNYPGLSSWQNYQTGNHTIKSKIIKRDDIFEVQQDGGFKVFQNMRNLLQNASKRTAKMELNPDGWMRAFPLDTPPEEMKKRINQLVKEEETKIQQEKKTFMGRVKLQNQGVDLTYQSKRSGRKMWCICSDIPKRIHYITYLKSLCLEAKETFAKYLQGDFSIPFPPGLFPPRLPQLSNLIEHRA